MKFQRSYIVDIDLGDDQVISVSSPLTMNFQMIRRQLSNYNTLNLSLYNLSPKNRDLIFQEFFGVRRRKSVTVRAGYNILATIFKGDIFEAFSMREGTDVITQIEARTGSWEIPQKQVYTTLAKGKTVGEVLEFLIGQFETIARGAVGKFDKVLQRPVVLNGNVYDLIRKYSDENVFIDNGKIYVLKRNEGTEGALSVINKDTGILSTPRRQGGFLQVDLLFEPRLRVGQFVSLESSILPIYNGRYKIVGIQHQGTISGAVGGDTRTTVDLFIGSQNFEVVQ